MAVLPTITETIEMGDASVYLSSINNAKGKLFGRRLSSPYSPVQIATVTDALRFQYDGDPTDTTLRGVADYLIWMTGAYGLQARYIISGSGGGAVIPAGGVGYIYTEISVTISADATTYQNNDMIGGKDLSFVILNNQLLSVANGDFTYSSVTGTLTFLTVQLFTGDKLVIPLNKKL